MYISHRTHLDSLWVRVHLGGVRVRVRVHKTRVRVRSAWVRVHRGGVRVRVRVHKGRVRVRTRVRTRTRTHPLSPSPSPDCSNTGCKQLTAHNWQKWKRVFLTCPCQKIYRDEAVRLKSCKYTWKITIFVKMWNLGQYRENLIFCS